MGWRIEFDSAAERDLDRLDPQAARRILVFLHDRIAALDNPRSTGTALRGATLRGCWRYRTGNYRIVVEIDDGSMTILVLRVGHRRNVYTTRR